MTRFKEIAQLLDSTESPTVETIAGKLEQKIWTSRHQSDDTGDHT